MARARAPAWCADYVGWPYRKHGRDRGGVDCIGLFLLIEREKFGVELPEYDGPGWEDRRTMSALADAARAFAERFEVVLPGNEREGDAVLMSSLGAPIHIGCVVAPGLMVHIEDGPVGSIVERYRSPAWERRIVNFHRPVVVA